MGSYLFNVALNSWGRHVRAVDKRPARTDRRVRSLARVRPEGLEPPTDRVGVFQNTSTPGPSEQRFL